MATVAHEGNPRNTPDLVVSGTLDGSVTLLMQFPALPIDNQIVLPPNAPNAFRVSTPFSDKYFLSVSDTSGDVTFQYGVDAFNHGSGYEQYRPSAATKETGTFIKPQGQVLEYSRYNNHPRYGAIISPRLETNFHIIDQNNSVLEFVYKDFTFKDFYAANNLLNWADWGKATTNADISVMEQTARADVYAAVTTHPISGVAVAVHPESTFSEFKGIAYIYDYATNFAYVSRYTGQPLTDLADVLWTEDFTGGPLTAADAFLYLTLRYDLTTGGVSLTGKGSLSLSGLTTGDLPYYGPDMRVAIVNLPRLDATNVDDYITWKSVHGIVSFT